jgi:hypothetical protein
MSNGLPPPVVGLAWLELNLLVALLLLEALDMVDEDVDGGEDDDDAKVDEEVDGDMEMVDFMDCDERF